MVNNFSKVIKKQRLEKRKQLRTLILNNENIKEIVTAKDSENGVGNIATFSQNNPKSSSKSAKLNKKNKKQNKNQESNGLVSKNELSTVKDQNDSKNKVEAISAVSLPKIKVKTTVAPSTSFEVKALDGNSPLSGQSSLMSLTSFGINELTLKTIYKLGLANMTKFQMEAIPALLEGRDLLATVRPKKEKCLAYIIPGIEILLKLKFNARHGTGIIILFPTRELAFEYYEIINEIANCHQFTCADIIGLNSKQYEENELRKGSNIVVATPGNLLHHLNNSNTFKYVNLQYLVVNGLSHMLKLGLSYDLNQIVKLLPKQRQTVLFSANLNEKSLFFSEILLKKLPLFVEEDQSLPKIKNADQLTVLYMLCPPDKRLLFLLSFLRVNQGKKIAILLSSCLSVQYHYNLLDYKDIPCCCVHGKQTSEQNLIAASRFQNSKSMILLCTNASSPDLNLEAPDWIVQYDPPDDIENYVEKKGRMIGNVSSKTMTLLMLRQKELGFVSYLLESGVTTKEMKYPAESVLDIQGELQKALKDMYFLHVSSRDGYSAFIRAYASHCLTSVFDIQNLDLLKEVLSFAFAIPPQVDFNVHNKQKGKLVRKKKKKSRKMPMVFETVSVAKKEKKLSVNSK